MLSNYKALRYTVNGYLKTAPSPVFLCSVDRTTRRRVTAHVNSRRDGREIRRGLDHALRDAGFDVRCRVRVHRERDLARAKSLEQLVGRFGNDWFMFDPTASLHRIRKIVSAARMERRILGERLSGFYLDSWRRVLYVVLDREAIGHLGENPEEVMRTAGARLVNHLNKSLQRTFLHLEVAMTFVHPAASLVPVDDLSLGCERRSGIRRDRANRRGLASALLTAAVGMGLPFAAQAEGPPVDGFNFKISGSGGEVDGDTAGIGQASAAFPLVGPFGAQIDGAGAYIDDNWSWAAGAHVFWRNPSYGLVGLVGSVGGTDNGKSVVGINTGGVPPSPVPVVVEKDFVYRLGGEVELYLGPYATIMGQGGVQRGDVEEGVYGRAILRLYPYENLALSAGYEAAPGPKNDRSLFGIEWQPPLNALGGLTIFADGAVGEDDYESVLGGIRLYFGESGNKTLKRRHREDDPDSLVPGIINALASAGQIAQDKAKAKCLALQDIYIGYCVP